SAPVGLWHPQGRGSGLYTVPGRALWMDLPLARPSLCTPLCVVRDLGRCDHDYRRWGVHTLPKVLAVLSPCSSLRLLSWGRSFLVYLAPDLRREWGSVESALPLPPPWRYGSTHSL